jgi:hypothetical protein
MYGTLERIVANHCKNTRCTCAFKPQADALTKLVSVSL